MANGAEVNGHQEIIDLTAKELHDGIRSGMFDVVGDVRTRGEWLAGHIPGAPHTWAPALVDMLKGCESCNIVVYCASGRRAGTAIRVLAWAGFKGKLYNGMGVGDYTAAGYQLTTSPQSVQPPCASGHGGTCRDGAEAVKAAAALPVVTQRNPNGGASVRVNGQKINGGNSNKPATPADPANSAGAPAHAQAPNGVGGGGIANEPDRPHKTTTVDATHHTDAGTATIRVRGGDRE